MQISHSALVRMTIILAIKLTLHIANFFYYWLILIIFFVFSILFFTINYLKLHNCINVTKTRGTLGSSLKSLGKLV